MTDDEKLKIDYEMSAQYFFHLADVRFKLLAFLPIVSGSALALVPQHLAPLEMFALGLLGLVVTVGVLLYDQRNSQIYNSLVGRLNLIEESLRRPAMRAEKQVGGAFLDRPKRRRTLFGLVAANHGVALDLVYSASVAAWLVVVSRAAARLSDLGQTSPAWWALHLLPLALSLALFVELRRVDEKSGWEGRLPGEVAARIDKSVASGGR
jgi:hypothetical protein